MAGVAVDLFLVYQFIRRLTTPFKEWAAFGLGIIDEKGNILKKRSTLSTIEERNSFRIFDLMVLRLKRLLEKVPGGKSKLASYAAALFLIKEYNENMSEEQVVSLVENAVANEMRVGGRSKGDKLKQYTHVVVNTEAPKSRYIMSYHSNEKNAKAYMDKTQKHIPSKLAVIKKTGKSIKTDYFNEDIANQVGAGAIAGIGIGPDGEPGISKKKQKKYTDKNKKETSGLLGRIKKLGIM
jgi:hypothetical protein